MRLVCEVAKNYSSLQIELLNFVASTFNNLLCVSQILWASLKQCFLYTTTLSACCLVI